MRALNLLMFVQLLLAGLDVGRLHWSATVPLALEILGLVGFATGMGLTTWAMLLNRFFSRAVRLQPDRGQQVVASGPYRLVRHPGYSGGLLLLLSAGFSLGSWIAMVPTLLMVPLMVRRTTCGEFRSRIVPGVGECRMKVLPCLIFTLSDSPTSLASSLTAVLSE